MSYKQLRRQIIENPTGVGAPFVATVNYFDEVTRKPVTLQFDSQVNDPSELTKGDEVFRFEYRPGKIRLVLYAGGGTVYTKNLAGPNPTPGIGTDLKLKVNPVNAVTSDSNGSDGVFDLTGQYGVPPYQLEVTGQYGNAAGYHKTAVSQVENYPVRFNNLRTGEYFLKVTDATGDFRTQVMTIQVGKRGEPSNAIIQDRIVRGRLLRARWLLNSLTVEYVGLGTENGNQDYQSPAGKLLDAFLLPGGNGKVWRQVYSDGKDKVYFVDTSTETTSTLTLDNIIYFDPDTPTEQNGGVLVEVTGSAPPFTFSLPGHPSNQLGSFDDLATGEYEVTVRDALGQQLKVPFSLKARHGLRWYLNFSDIYGVPCRLELWLRDYQGEPELIKAGADPVVITSDGLSNAIGGQGDLPSVVATTCELNLKTLPDQLLEVETGDDTNCRVDVHRAGKMEFRGFVQTGLYDGELQAGLIDVSLTATDGLATLKGTWFTGHIGQRLGGHRRLLSSQVHCLARTSVALPVQIYTNRRDAAMSDEDAPELAATTNRLAYWDESKNEPLFMRAALDALAQAEGGTMVQREGAWQVRSILEAAQRNVPGRAYKPAGTPVGDLLVSAPTGVLEPPTRQRWYWLKGDSAQTKHVRAAWKSLTGTTDVGWLKNAFWQGAVFSDTYAWLDDASKLRGTSGWKAGGGTPFPLILQRVGEKGKDHSTLWPRSLDLRTPDYRWFESPPLPLAPGMEGVPAVITFTGKFVASETFTDSDGVIQAPATVAKTATLGYEIYIDGRAAGMAGLATFDLATGTNAQDTTFEAPLPLMPSGAKEAILRLYAWTAPDVGQLDLATPAPSNLALTFMPGSLVKSDFGTGKMRLFVARHDYAAQPLTDTTTWAEIEATNASTGQLLLTSVGIQLRPQNATWDGEDNFRADGPAGGTIRPTEPLEVFHADIPITAGLYGGNLNAFAKGIALADGTMSTSWARRIDLAASPIFESNVYDALSLRSGHSNLLTGTIRHENCDPPRLLDTVDTPYDLPGRRFCVGATAWHMKFAKVEVSLIQNGVGDDAPDPNAELPDGARVIDRVYEYAMGKYTSIVRGCSDGSIRVRGV
ncbi:MAG: hypothetical protein ACRYFV_13610 [Janthinobacterium lividum]